MKILSESDQKYDAIISPVEYRKIRMHFLKTHAQLAASIGQQEVQ